MSFHFRVRCLIDKYATNVKRLVGFLLNFIMINMRVVTSNYFGHCVVDIQQSIVRNMSFNDAALAISARDN